MSAIQEFRSAFATRRIFGASPDEPLRWFHGPGEGTGERAAISMDRFRNFVWITAWDPLSENLEKELIRFLQEEEKLTAAVLMDRTRVGSLALPRVLFGEIPKAPLMVQEGSRRLKFEIRFDARHPGLFLDLADFRENLVSGFKVDSVLNAFCFTGSLSVAAKCGGAGKVTSLDLSKSTMEWAKRNWALNQFPEDQAEWISGDALEIFKKWGRQGRRFDAVLLDPPSFSRTKEGKIFSTQKDLELLVDLSVDLIPPGGFFFFSINSENISRDAFRDRVLKQVRTKKRSALVLGEVGLPPTFPTVSNDLPSRYLKGLFLQL